MSPSLDRIATGTIWTVKLLVEEPDALMWARPDLWEPWVVTPRATRARRAKELQQTDGGVLADGRPLRSRDFLNPTGNLGFQLWINQLSKRREVFLRQPFAGLAVRFRRASAWSFPSENFGFTCN